MRLSSQQWQDKAPGLLCPLHPAEVCGTGYEHHQAAPWRPLSAHHSAAMGKADYFPSSRFQMGVPTLSSKQLSQQVHIGDGHSPRNGTAGPSKPWWSPKTEPNVQAWSIDPWQATLSQKDRHIAIQPQHTMNCLQNISRDTSSAVPSNSPPSKAASIRTEFNHNI